MATRPGDENGLGLTVIQVQAELTRIKNLFRLLPDTPAIYPVWERLVIQPAVLGKNVHDARLVAAKVPGITHLLTFNGQDFKRFQGVITIVAPTDIISPPEQSQNP